MAGEIKYLGRKNEERKEDYQISFPVVDKNGSETGKNINLIWGDPVKIIEQSGKQIIGFAREKTVKIPADVLSDTERLLEVYIIDVGQGDGILMKTPDGHWHVIDAGVSHETKTKSGMTQNGASNFIHWKFIRELGSPLYDEDVVLKNVILSHPDDDHYGGLIDILSGNLRKWDTPRTVTVENFYHNGIGRFTDEPKLGQIASGTAGKSFVTELLDAKGDFAANMDRFDDDFKKLAKLIVSVPKNVGRISNKTGYLPGYGPGQNSVTIRVLGPILEDFGAGQGLRSFSDPRKTVNGHSVILRIEYGDISILLAGDLNRKSQQLLLSYWDKKAFESDIAKACHHGGEDISYEFIKAVKARATVFSSGDNETYAHPRPVLMGASALYGRESINAEEGDESGETMPPLIYSTELARSIKMDFATSVKVRQKEKKPAADADGLTEDTDNEGTRVDKKNVLIWAKAWKDNKKPYRTLDQLRLPTKLIYGLVNIRTDGQTVLMGTLMEAKQEFEIKVFRKQ